MNGSAATRPNWNGEAPSSLRKTVVGEPVVAVSQTEPKNQPSVMSPIERRGVQPPARSPAEAPARTKERTTDVSADAGWSCANPADFAIGLIWLYPADTTRAARKTGAATTPAAACPVPRDNPIVGQ